MTKFNDLPFVSAQLTRLAADSGFRANLDVEVPYGWETASLVLEGILKGYGNQEFLYLINDRQRAALRPYVRNIEVGTKMADALFDSPELCMAIYNGGSLFSERLRTACKYINEYAECAFEGAIADAIGCF